MLQSMKFCHGLRIRLVLSQCPTIPMLTSGINFGLKSLALLGNFSTPDLRFFCFMFMLFWPMLFFCFVPVFLFYFNMLLFFFMWFFFLFWFFLFLDFFLFLWFWLKSDKLVEWLFSFLDYLDIDLNDVLRNGVSPYG